MKRHVKVIQDFPEVELVGRKLGPFKKGEEVRLRAWEASILEDRGVVRTEDVFSPTGLRKLLIREEKSSQLEDIPSHFYQSVSQKIEKLCKEGEKEKADEIKEAVISLISLRIQKIARMTISSVEPEEVPPEEVFLVNRLSQSLKVWRERLDQIFEKTHKEAGAHEKRIRRSIQGIVRDTADIQE